MKWHKIPWPAVFSFMSQETILNGVCRQHLAHFSKSLFKTKFLNNKRQIESMYRGKQYMSPHKMPAVFLGYEIDDNSKNTQMTSSFPYESGAHFIAGPLSTYYYRIYSNPKTKATIFANFIRKKFTVHVRYVFPDRYQQDDFYNYLINTFPYEGPGIKFNVDSRIWAPLPTNMIEYLAVMHGYNLADPAFGKRLIREMEEYSSGIIMRKSVNLQNKTAMFFFCYKDPLMKIMQPERPERDDGEQVGQIMTRFGITETLVFEPHIPTMFVTNVPEIIFNRKVPSEYRPQTFGGYDIDPRKFNTRCMDIPTIIKSSLDENGIIITSEEFGVAKDGKEVINLFELISAEHITVLQMMLDRCIPPYLRGETVNGIILHHKCRIDTRSDLPTTGVESGDLYYIKDEGIYVYAKVNSDTTIEWVYHIPKVTFEMIEYFMATASSAYKIVVFGFGTQLKYGIDYIFDWYTGELIIFNASSDVMYRMQIIRNKALTDAFLKNLHIHDDKVYRSDITYTVKLNINGIMSNIHGGDNGN